MIRAGEQCHCCSPPVPLRLSQSWWLPELQEGAQYFAVCAQEIAAHVLNENERGRTIRLKRCSRWDVTAKPLCKPEIQQPLPFLPLLYFGTHFFISPATHSMSLKSYFLPACLLSKPALHQCIRLIESSVLVDSSVMTHDIQLMLFFLPGGLSFFFRFAVACETPELVFEKYSLCQDNFQTFSISLFTVLSLLSVSQASHYCRCLSTSC